MCIVIKNIKLFIPVDEVSQFSSVYFFFKPKLEMNDELYIVGEIMYSFNTTGVQLRHPLYLFLDSFYEKEAMVKKFFFVNLNGLINSLISNGT